WAKGLVNADKAAADLAELRALTAGFGFEAFEKNPTYKQEAAEIRKRAGTNPAALASMDVTTLQALHDQIVKDLRMVSKVLVDTADQADLEKEMDSRAGAEEESKGVAQVEFWKAALEKQFGFKVNIPEGVEASKLSQLYRLIKRLPPSQVMKDLVDSF